MSSILESLFGNRRPAGGEDPVGRAKAMVAEGALLLDVRTEPEFASGHVPGATCIPVGELSARLGEIAAGRAVVLYCRSGARSATAARLLAKRGHEVLDLGPMPRRW